MRRLTHELILSQQQGDEEDDDDDEAGVCFYSLRARLHLQATGREVTKESFPC